MVQNESLERRLAAILSADAVGYSRLMGDDEEATVRTLQGHRKRIARLVDSFRGRVVDSPGDNVLVEFPSAVGAVRCALEVQRTLAAENEKFDEERRMRFRIGVHLADVLVDEGQLFGDGVNIAARLESLAAPGAICLSDLVYQQVRQRLDLEVTDLGDQELKNIEDPVRVLQVATESVPPEGVPVRSIAAARVALKPPDKPSLAVLPFFNLNGDPREEHFSDGLTIDIMAELVRIPGLFLIGQDSAFTYKSTAAKPGEVAHELGVRHVLEGSVRRDEKRLRVTARLIEGASGQHVWAERYDGGLEDIFEVQDSITDSVVTALDVALVGGEDARAIRQHLRTPQGVGLVYRGMERLHRFTQDDMAEARRLFTELIDLEPDSPIPYVETAWTHYFDVERGWTASPQESLTCMSQLSNQSLERGDISGFAYFMLGNMHLMRREHDKALEMADLALQERPSCQGAWGLKANILNYCGLPEEAVPLAQQSMRLSPVAQTFYPEVLATAHYLTGHLEEAMSTAHEALALAPDSLDSRIVLAAALVETGRPEAAQESARELLAIDPRFSLELLRATRPYRDPAVLERLAGSLGKAGISERGAEATLAREPVLGAAARRRVAPRPRRS